MKHVLRWLFLRELMIAVHLGTVGQWWAGRAAHRLDKLEERS